MSDFRQRYGAWIGLAGVGTHEHAVVHAWHRRFEWLLIPMVLWLPLQMYFEYRGVLASTHSRVIDWLIWFAFLFETSVMFAIVQHKLRYLRGNWMNVVIVLVAFPLLKSHSLFAAFAAIFRLLILLTVMARVGVFMRSLLSRNQLGPILIVVTMIAVLGGIFISLVDPTFKTVWDGIWWSFVTLTTVGYGDLVPVTASGRVFAVILMLMGVGLIALLSATMAELFLEDDERKMYRQGREILHKLSGQLDEFHRAQEDRDEMLRLLKQLSDRLDAIETKLDGRN